LILTTGGFTRSAQREATRDGAPPIDLIDGELLIEKIKELKLGVSVNRKMVEVVEVDRGWFDSI
jgi:restriction system protein